MKKKNFIYSVVGITIYENLNICSFHPSMPNLETVTQLSIENLPKNINQQVYVDCNPESDMNTNS